MGLQNPVAGDGEENQHGDETVGGEESGVQFAEVVGLDQRVLVEQGSARDGDAGNGKVSEAEADALERQLARFMSEADNAPPVGDAPAIPKARGTECSPLATS